MPPFAIRKIGHVVLRVTDLARSGPGAMRGIDPETGQHYDDTRRYLDAIDWLGAAERDKIFRGNVEKVYPRLLRRHAARIVSLRT